MTPQNPPQLHYTFFITILTIETNFFIENKRGIMDELFVECLVETRPQINSTALVLDHMIDESRAMRVLFADGQTLEGRRVRTEVIPIDCGGGGQRVVADDLLEVRVLYCTGVGGTS